MADTEMQRGQLTPEQAKIVKEFSAIHRRQWEAMLGTMRQMGEAIGEALRQAAADVRPPVGEPAEGNAVRILVDALDRIGARIHRDVDPESSYMDVGALDQLAPLLTNFTAYADEQLRALDHPAVLAALAEKASAPLATHYPGDGQAAEVRTEWGVDYGISGQPALKPSQEEAVRVLTLYRALNQSRHVETGAPLRTGRLLRRTVTVGPWVPADAPTPEVDHAATGQDTQP